MTADDEIGELQAAIDERARALVEECLARGRQERDRILEQENERLRLWEERETLAAKAKAERTYRRKVQASQLRAEEGLDRLRWELARGVLQQLPEQARQVADDDERYLPLLRDLLQRAAQSIEANDLVVEINERDHGRLADGWQALAAELAPGRQLRLHPEPLSCIGGARVRDEANTVLVDATFEARMERLDGELAENVIERLFAHALHTRELLHG